MNIYEMYGRQAEQLNQAEEYFNATQKVLHDLKSGTVLPSQLVIAQGGWHLGEPDTSQPDRSPAEPGETGEPGEAEGLRGLEGASGAAPGEAARGY